MKKRIISSLCTVISALTLLSFSGCEEPTTEDMINDKVGANSDLITQIIVDKETLVQYIFYGNCDNIHSRVVSLTVRLKEDGTPYTIDRKDLDKYPCFTFDEINKKENE